MAILMAVFVDEQCVGRCDAKCYAGNSPPESCTCLCRGLNHGVGLRQAVDNTRQYSSRWQSAWRAENPSLAARAVFEIYDYTVMRQNSFFDGMDKDCAIANQP